jgi:enolase
MAVKLKFHDHTFSVELGQWSCETEPELAAFLQELMETELSSTSDYLIDKDFQGAAMVAKRIGAEIIWSSDQEDDFDDDEDPDEPLRVY